MIESLVREIRDTNISLRMRLSTSVKYALLLYTDTLSSTACLSIILCHSIIDLWVVGEGLDLPIKQQNAVI